MIDWQEIKIQLEETALNICRDNRLKQIFVQRRYFKAAKAEKYLEAITNTRQDGTLQKQTSQPG